MDVVSGIEHLPVWQLALIVGHSEVSDSDLVSSEPRASTIFPSTDPTGKETVGIDLELALPETVPGIYHPVRPKKKLRK